MKLLILLQNAYGVEDGYIPDFSRDSFRNSQSGRRLKEILPNQGEEIFIRNCNPAVGKVSSSWFPPDLDYILTQIKLISPDVVVACGVNAKESIDKLNLELPVIKMPHPAYRALSKEITGNVRKELLNEIRR